MSSNFKIGKIKLLISSFLRAQIWWVYQCWCLAFKFCIFQVQKWPDCSKNANKVLVFSQNLNLKNLTTSFWQVFSSKLSFQCYKSDEKILSNQNRKKFEFFFKESKFYFAFFEKTGHFCTLKCKNLESRH